MRADGRRLEFQHVPQREKLSFVISQATQGRRKVYGVLGSGRGVLPLAQRKVQDPATTVATGPLSRLIDSHRREPRT
jgi:hypothetical protein